MLNLSSEDLQIVLDILKKYTPKMTVYAYGSRVTKKSHAGSDLDLVIINPENKYPINLDMTEIRQAFIDSDLPMSVDIFLWDEIPDSFKEEISKHKIKIFG